MATASLTWCPVFLLEVGSTSSLSLLPRAFHQRSLPMSPGSLSPPRSLVHSRGSLQPPISWGCLFPFFLLALRASVLLPHSIPDQVSLYPLFPPTLSTFPPRFFSLSPLVIAFFSLPSGTEVSSLGHFSLLSFLSSVDCTLDILYFLFCFVLADIHLLVSIYHACPFGSELPH